MIPWLVIPANGRADVSHVAFAGIRWLIDELWTAASIFACAIVVADDENLEVAREHGLDTLERSNMPLGRKWNDGFEAACAAGASHVVSCGSDDWIHPDLIRAHLAAADDNTIMCSRASTVISPTGREATTLRISYDGGDGVRMLPRKLLAALDCRPYNDTRSRALDGAMFDRLQRSRTAFEWRYTDLHPWQIVDFKSAENLTAYDKFPSCEHDPQQITDPLDQLAAHYPAALVDRARELYGVAQ